MSSLNNKKGFVRGVKFHIKPSREEEWTTDSSSALGWSIYNSKNDFKFNLLLTWDDIEVEVSLSEKALNNMLDEIQRRKEDVSKPW